LRRAAPGAGSERVWADEANARCGELERELGAVDPPREVEEPEELAAFVAATAAAVDIWLGRMRELEPPEEDVAQVERMLDHYGDAVQKTEQAAEAVAAGDEDRYRQLVEAAERSSARGDKIALELGAHTCPTRFRARS